MKILLNTFPETKKTKMHLSAMCVYLLESDDAKTGNVSCMFIELKGTDCSGPIMKIRPLHRIKSVMASNSPINPNALYGVG